MTDDEPTTQTSDDPVESGALEHEEPDEPWSGREDDEEQDSSQ